MKNFLEFVDKKEREARNHLKIIKGLLESKGLKVSAHLEKEEPFVFMFNPSENVSFEGIRIYQIGDQIAFRIQKEEHTQPFGQAYPLDIEDMFNDLISDHHDPEEAGKKVIDAVVKEVKHFFVQTAESERLIRSNQFGPMGKVVIGSSDTQNDYSNKVT